MIKVTDNKEIKETVLAGLKHNKDTFESTELYKMLLPNISMGGVQFATIYYYD